MAEWIYVVDDDMANLQMAGRILSKNGMRVSAFQSGRAMLEALSAQVPDLILLDIMMPEMDGFETLAQMRLRLADIQPPVIFLTGDDGPGMEARGLKMGAMDFIRKPFVPEVLVLRVRHTIDLVRLQRSLAQEVAGKTEAIRQLSLEIVETLAEAIDAKDAYTHGHSKRVAEYSAEIARRMGYDAHKCREMYMMGLLHDIGKIGIPDAVINKKGKLTDEEFAIIKTHPAKGSKILDNIEQMPELAVGAHWHHERYDGRGYPDGLSGHLIPEPARIIAVADAYDAMTSNRSYRTSMTQQRVREEMEKGKGTQFDPDIADIMLRMIDEDRDFQMREHETKAEAE